MTITKARLSISLSKQAIKNLDKLRIRKSLDGFVQTKSRSEMLEIIIKDFLEKEGFGLKQEKP